MNAKLYFATNRNHQGTDQWKPDGYGKKFSHDGHYNLRFGDLEISCDEDEIKKHLTKDLGGNRTGDGESLSGYFSKKVKNASITAYKDKTANSTSEIEFDKNSSTHFFKNLKNDMSRNSDVLIFIHGYNVSWSEAVGSAMSLQYMLNRHKKRNDKEVIVVLFSWPSDGSMMPFAAYKSDRSDARDSAQAIGRAILKLRYFLSKIRKKNNDETMKPCAQNIHLLAHSMGNYVLQNSLIKISGYSAGNRMPRIFENLFLCAADVDDDCLEKGEKMGDLHELTNHISIYHNKGDLGMYISDFTKGNPQRLGNIGAARPQLIHNKIHQVNCSNIVKGFVEHSYYQWSTVNDDIRMTIDEVPFDNDSRNRKRLANNREWELL